MNILGPDCIKFNNIIPDTYNGYIAVKMFECVYVWWKLIFLYNSTWSKKISDVNYYKLSHSNEIVKHEMLEIIKLRKAEL